MQNLTQKDAARHQVIAITGIGMSKKKLEREIFIGDGGAVAQVLFHVHIFVFLSM